MMVGPCVLFFLAFFIAERRGLSALDLAYWSVVLAAILARHVDVTRLEGQTDDGKPATLGHWRRFVLLMVLVAGAVWILAHGLLVHFMA
jgi:hypothetical protein